MRQKKSREGGPKSRMNGARKDWKGGRLIGGDPEVRGGSIRARHLEGIFFAAGQV